MSAEAISESGGHRFYVPEVHDLRPGVGLAALHALLPVAARTVCAHLYVPHWQGFAEETADAPLARDLRAHSGTLVLHGLTHTRGERLLARILHGQDDRGEFASLSRDRALGRLEEAAKRFHALFDEPPRWFCAPQWRQSRGTREALKAVGIDHVMHTHGYVTPRGRVRLPVVSFDVGARRLVQALHHRPRARNIRSLLHRGRPFRLALHPDDLDRPVIRRQITDLTGRLAAEGWTPLSADAACTRLLKEQVP